MQGRVERRVDAEPTLVDALAPVDALEVLAHLLDEVRRLGGTLAVDVEAEEARLGLAGLVLPDVLLLEHALEDVVSSLPGAVRKIDGGKSPRTLGETGQERGLLEGRARGLAC